MRSSSLRAILILSAAAAVSAFAAAAAPVATENSQPTRDAPALGPVPDRAPSLAADSAASVPESSSASPQAPALKPGLSARERVRRARSIDREAIRAERLERRAAINVSRDSARRLDNFYLGAGLVRAQYSAYSGSDTEMTESSSPLGIWFGYRTHFARFLGLRTGGLVHFGSTQVVRGEEDPVLFSTLSSYPDEGSNGMTFEIDASAQAILGPFGRFSVEPGVYYGFGWHTAKSIPLTYGYGSGSQVYQPRPRFSVAGMMLGASLFFGNRDQFNLMGTLSVGKALGSADATVSSAGLGFCFAFQDG
jgi:hypothetical protein